MEPAAGARLDAFRSLYENAYGQKLTDEQRLLRDKSKVSEEQFNLQVACHYNESRGLTQGALDTPVRLDIGARSLAFQRLTLDPQQALWQDGKVALSNLRLPLSVQNKVPGVPVTVMDWLKTCWSHRIDWDQFPDIFVTPYTSCACLPINPQTKSAEFTVQASHKGNESWMYLTYTSSGDKGTWFMDFQGISGAFTVHAGEQGEQKKFAFFPVDRDTRQRLEDEAPALAREVAKSSVVTIAIRFEKLDPDLPAPSIMDFLLRDNVSPFAREEHYMMKAGLNFGGIMGTGGLDRRHYQKAEYTGKFKVAQEGHFVAICSGLAVDASSCATEADLTALFTTLDKDRTILSGSIKEQLNLRAKEDVINGMFVKLVLKPKNTAPNFFVGTDGRSYLDFTARASTDSQGYFLFDGKRVLDLTKQVFMKFSPIKNGTETLPQVVHLDLDKDKLIVSDYDVASNTYQSHLLTKGNIGWSYRSNESRTFRPEEMSVFSGVEQAK